jgi:hypothetical protein
MLSLCLRPTFVPNRNSLSEHVPEIGAAGGSDYTRGIASHRSGYFLTPGVAPEGKARPKPRGPLQSKEGRAILSHCAPGMNCVVRLRAGWSALLPGRSGLAQDVNVTLPALRGPQTTPS